MCYGLYVEEIVNHFFNISHKLEVCKVTFNRINDKGKANHLGCLAFFLLYFACNSLLKTTDGEAGEQTYIIYFLVTKMIC